MRPLNIKIKDKRCFSLVFFFVDASLDYSMRI